MISNYISLRLSYIDIDLHLVYLIAIDLYLIYLITRIITRTLIFRVLGNSSILRR